VRRLLRAGGFGPRQVYEIDVQSAADPDFFAVRVVDWFGGRCSIKTVEQGEF
jgi:hypothetical protein